MADQGANTSSTTVTREYRKGNWTVSETMILIEAKKMDDERRMKRITGNENDQGRSSTTTSGSNKPAELRWKWVEDYCWRKGCMRSQNQCNDKWDNLMRDYKKVRDYERKIAEKSGGVNEDQSYWKIEKNERKEKNLPTNMLPHIYDALFDVVERKSQRALGGISGVSSIPSSSPSIGYQMVERTMSGGGGVVHHPHHHLQQPPLMASQALLQPHHPISATPIAALPLPPAPVTVAAAEVAVAVAVAPPYVQAQPLPPALPYSQPILSTMCDSSDSDTSEHPNSPAKRRRKAPEQQQQQHHHHHQGTGTAPTTSASGRSSSSSSDQVVATAISKSASIIAEALQACEEREERRHRDLVSLHEKRLKIEESKNEVNKQGINGLVEAINKLANSIQALASDRNQSTSKPS